MGLVPSIGLLSARTGEDEETLARPGVEANIPSRGNRGLRSR